MFDPLPSDRPTIRRVIMRLVAFLVALGVDAGVVGLAVARQLMVEPVPEPRFVSLGPPCGHGARSRSVEPPWPDIHKLARSPVARPPAPPPPLPTRPPQPPGFVGDQPIRLSHGVEAATRIKAPAPELPPLARKAGLQGIVILEVIIDQNGTVTDSRVLRDIGLGCGEAARAAVLTWKFRPARLDGRPISIYQIVTVRFESREGATKTREGVRSTDRH